MSERRPFRASFEGAAGYRLLARICDACLRGLPVTGVLVSAAIRAEQELLLYASDSTAATLGDLEADLGEGPGIDALADRLPVSVDDLTDTLAADERWPLFAAGAADAGARALFAFPLVLGAARVGSLVLYSDKPRRLDAAQTAHAIRLADAAVHAVVDLFSGAPPAGSPDHDGDRGADLDEVLAPLHRAEVYQAAGMIMVQLGVGIEEATVRLRGYAFAGDRPVLDVAHEILERRLRLDDDDKSGSS